MADGADQIDAFRLTGIVGRAGDDAYRERLHDMGHHGLVENVTVARADAARRRMRLTTDKGRDCALMLPREAKLSNGAILHLSDDLAIVVRIEDGPRLRLTPSDSASALRLGFFCGNLHWAATFDGAVIEIEMDGAEADYLRRLQDAAENADFAIETPT